MAKFIFTWDNLKYSVKQKRESFVYDLRQRSEKKLIIDGVSGLAISGSVIAIMGISGCGKTTLLTLLSGNRRGNGILRINGRIINGKSLRHNSAFLPQNDLFIESLTVYEHISFTAAMCLNTSYSTRIITVHQLLRDFNIEKLKYTKIEYLSSGEKRKLALASKLLSDPYILFCDEPTTGLDSYSAVSVVRILETIANTGKIVFLTVHQPSSQLFEMFDNIILLSANGKVAFQGSKDTAKSFFESQDLFCPSAYNPADFYIKSLVIKSTVDQQRVNQLIEAFRQNYAVKFNFSEIDYDGLLLKQGDSSDNRFLYTLGWLTWRTFIDIRRHLKQTATTFLLIMVSALIVAVTYSKTNILEFSGVQSIQGALLLIVSELIFDEMYQVIYTFPSEIDVFIQEKNLYSAFPYFLSKIISLIPFAIVHSLGFLTIYFFCLQFLDSVHLFFNMYLILFGAALGGSALGLCLSALFPTVDSIHLFIVPLALLCLLLSGLWIRVDSLPRIFAAIKYFSPFYVSFESISIVYWINIQGIDLCTKVQNVTCYHDGKEVLASYDFISSYDKVVKNLLYLLVLILIYSYIGYIGILRKRALYQL